MGYRVEPVRIGGSDRISCWAIVERQGEKEKVVDTCETETQARLEIDRWGTEEHDLSRRSMEQAGYVRFPVDSDEYRSTGEGGMFVRLVVIPVQYGGFMKCCGGFVEFDCDECFIGDDITSGSIPEDFAAWIQRVGYDDGTPGLNPEQIDIVRQYLWEQEIGKEAHVEECFPLMEARGIEHPGGFRSISLLAVITLGSTGWSGYNKDNSGYWHCTYNDLTDEGKALYDGLKALYGDAATLHLQTWLDT